MSKEPVVYIAALSAIAVGILPVLMIFEVMDWTVAQYGAVETFIVLVSSTLSAMFVRSRVSPINAG